MRRHFLVGEQGVGVRHFQDEHVMSLFTDAEYERAATASGLSTAEWLPGWSSGRNLLVATR
jgi:hypothetical protein